MTKDHFATLPAGEQHNQDRNQRQAQTERHHCARAVTIALVKAEQLDEHQDDIADRMLPSIAKRANAPVAKKVDKAGNGR
jgi:hypothetical protein